MARIQDYKPHEDPDIMTNALKALMKTTLKKDLTEFAETIIDDVIDKAIKSLEVNITHFKNHYDIQDYYKVKVERI